MSAVPVAPPRRLLDVEIDGAPARVPEGSTILDACRAAGVDTPTMCYADTLTPVNACRVCVVELEGARTLVPACSRPVEPGMKVRTHTERVRRSRKLVMELLASSVDTSLSSADWHRWQIEYEADPDRFGAPMQPSEAGQRDARGAGHHHMPGDPTLAETVPGKLPIRSRTDTCRGCAVAVVVKSRASETMRMQSMILRPVGTPHPLLKFSQPCKRPRSNPRAAP